MSRWNITLVTQKVLSPLIKQKIDLFSKLINIAVPKTIDERAINLNLSKQDIFRQSENLELG
jgi:hypothetical protein